MKIDIRDAAEGDLPRILDITNEVIANTTAVWSLAPTTLAARQAWYAERRANGFPVLVATVDEDVLGFASFGEFRAWDGYAHTVENSIYVDAVARGRGIGAALLSPLIGRAEALGKHVMVAGIEGRNEASIRLHARFGFVETGRLVEVGRKFGRWLDLVFMQRALGA